VRLTLLGVGVNPAQLALHILGKLLYGRSKLKEPSVVDKKAKPSTKHFKPKNIITLLLGLIVLVVIVIWLTNTAQSKNYAAEIAKPIENSFTAAGAKKVCESGDAGRGPDNKAPNYAIIFETNSTNDKASELLKQVALDNGYSLQKLDSNNQNITSYYDHTHKSSFSDLKDGPVLLAASLYDGGSSLSCQHTNVFYDKDHTAIKVDISLPEYKK
jgi:hypothetical protein